MRHVLNLRQIRCGMSTYQRAGRIEAAEAFLNLFGLGLLRQTDVDGGQNPARDGQKVRRELDLIRAQAELLQYLAGVAMAEDCIGRKIVSGRHKVSLGRRRLPCTAHAGFGVADDTVVQI